MKYTSTSERVVGHRTPCPSKVLVLAKSSGTPVTEHRQLTWSLRPVSIEQPHRAYGTAVMLSLEQSLRQREHHSSPFLGGAGRAILASPHTSLQRHLKLQDVDQVLAQPTTSPRGDASSED